LIYKELAVPRMCLENFIVEDWKGKQAVKEVQDEIDGYGGPSHQFRGVKAGLIIEFKYLVQRKEYRMRAM
jgi:hypothetical protein